jgi:hypothetical protein
MAVENQNTLNLIVIGYGLMYCDCNCCFGMTYQFLISKNGNKYFKKIEWITINSKENTKFKIIADKEP